MQTGGAGREAVGVTSCLPAASAGHGSVARLSCWPASLRPACPSPVRVCNRTQGPGGLSMAGSAAGSPTSGSRRGQGAGVAGFWWGLFLAHCLLLGLHAVAETRELPLLFHKGTDPPPTPFRRPRPQGLIPSQAPPPDTFSWGKDADM